MTKIYYAHPMSWYGTHGEALDLVGLASEGEVINPNTPYFQTRVLIAQQNSTPVMQVFADFICSPKCDVVAFRRFNDGKIGAGVAREIFEALIWGKEVWEIRNIYGGDQLIDKALQLDNQPDGMIDIVLGDILTVEETRRRCKEGIL